MIIGFESVKSTLLEAHHNQKLHHAILLHGKKGSGKASFAKELVGEIFGSNLSAHPDLLLIEKDLEKKEITVDRVRKIAEFVNQTSAISPHKFIIIDSACELNKSASNSILKILEEPHPNNFLILISHNLNRVLPTIRSRCLMVKIADLSLLDFNKILRQKNPAINDADLKFLAEICDNSPAQAITFEQELPRFYSLFVRSILNKKISDELLKKIADKNFPFVIFEKSYEFFISRLLKFLSGANLNFYFDEEKVLANLSQKRESKNFFAMAEESLNLLHKTIPLSLDKKLTFINIFNLISYD